MRVETQANSFRVTWNRSLPALRDSAGVLKIDDGRQPRELQLDRNQITTGSLVYVTNATDLTFRMQVRGEQGRQLTESVRVIVAKPSPAEAPETVKEAAKPVPDEGHEPKPEDIRRPTGPGPLARTVVRSWPTMLQRAGAAYRPAHPLRRIMPEIRTYLVPKPTIVKIQVRVDSEGHVTEAHELDSDPNPAVSPGVPALALEATRRWTFEPAKSRGHTVPSDYKIIYWFSPP
jgi:hypothetical protein